MSTSRYNTYSDNYSASYISSKMPTYAILEHSSLQQPQVTLSQLVALGKVHSFLDVFLKLRKKLQTAGEQGKVLVQTWQIAADSFSETNSLYPNSVFQKHSSWEDQGFSPARFSTEEQQ